MSKQQRTTLNLNVSLLRRYRAVLLRNAERPEIAEHDGPRYLAIAEGLRASMAGAEDSGSVPVTTVTESWSVLADVALEERWYAEGSRFHQHARQSLFALPTEQVIAEVDGATMAAVRKAAAAMEH